MPAPYFGSGKRKKKFQKTKHLAVGSFRVVVPRDCCLIQDYRWCECSMCAFLLEVNLHGVALMLALTSHWNYKQWQLMAIPINCYSSDNCSDLTVNPVIESSRSKEFILKKCVTHFSHHVRGTLINNKDSKILIMQTTKKKLWGIYEKCHINCCYSITWKSAKKLDHHLIYCF